MISLCLLSIQFNYIYIINGNNFYFGWICLQWNKNKARSSRLCFYQMKKENTFSWMKTQPERNIDPLLLFGSQNIQFHLSSVNTRSFYLTQTNCTQCIMHNRFHSISSSCLCVFSIVVVVAFIIVVEYCIQIVCVCASVWCVRYISNEHCILMIDIVRICNDRGTNDYKPIIFRTSYLTCRKFLYGIFWIVKQH